MPKADGTPSSADPLPKGYVVVLWQEPGDDEFMFRTRVFWDQVEGLAFAAATENSTTFDHFSSPPPVDNGWGKVQSPVVFPKWEEMFDEG